MPSHITLKRTLLDLQPTGTRRICVNSILPHPRAGRHEVLRYSAPSPQRFGANSHDHQECNTLGRWRRLPDHDLDLVVSTRADGRRHRTRKLLAPARRLRPAVRPLCRARPLLAPASPLWPSAGRYGPAPGSYTPQSQYVPPPAGPQVITNGPQTNPGDVSPSWSPQRNVAESEHYDRLLKENPAFRQARMRKECGPITDPQLHQQCLDSFARY